MKQHALDWAARGFRIFPLVPGGKKPAFAKWNWTEKATVDPDEIEKWWSVADYNIGVLTTGLIVVDADNKHGKTGSMEYIDRGWPTDTLSVKTPSGGEHFYFTGPDRSNSVDLLAFGLDIRAKNGYVIAPGSRLDPDLPDNKGVGGDYILTVDAPLQPAPEDLIGQLLAPREKSDTTLPATELDRDDALNRGATFAKTVPASVYGEGADLYTFRVVCQIKDIGVSESQAFDLLAEHYLPRCIAPRTPEEQHNWLARKVENAYAYGSLPAGVSSPHAEFSGVDIPEPVFAAVDPLPAANRWIDHGSEWNVDISWLFYKVLPQSGAAFLVGPPGAGKTFVALELARCLATGKKFFEVEPDDKGGAVFLFGGTEGSGLEERMAALGEEERLPISATRVHGLGQGDTLAQMRDEIRRKAEQMQEVHGVPLRLVVIETLSASGLLEDENSNSEAAAAMSALAQVGRDLGVLMLVTHHPPKNGSGERGAGAIRGSADYVLEIQREGSSSIRELAMTKARNAPERILGSFSLVPVVLGKDSRGREVSSLTVSSGAPQTKLEKVIGAQAEFLDILAAAIYADGDTIDGKDWILEADARAAYRERKVGSKDGSNVAKQWSKQLAAAVETAAVDEMVWMGRKYVTIRTMA